MSEVSREHVPDTQVGALVSETEAARRESLLASSRSVKVESPWQEAARRFRRHRLAVAGLVGLVILSLMAIFAPVVAQHDPNRGDFRQIDQPPSREYWLGTDGNGRDYWSRLVYGARVSLSVGLIATGIAVFIGTILGAISGYYGG